MNPGTFCLYCSCSLVLVSDSIYIKRVLIPYYVTRLGYNTVLYKYDIALCHKYIKAEKISSITTIFS
jgi:hypothetical protein